MADLSGTSFAIASTAKQLRFIVEFRSDQGRAGQMQLRNLFFSVGEPSGDLHASKLISNLRELAPNVKVRGFGGPRMVESGLQIDFELTNLAVVGIVEVLPKLREFFRVADQAESIFRSGEIEGVVLVDFPGFNWHIAKRAKKYGIPVFYYLPPQLWAWASWRVKKVQRWVDQVISGLPFEPAWFRERGVDVEYVGHPFFDEVYQRVLDRPFIDRCQSKGILRIAILPGSRGHEVHHNWPLQLELIRRLSKKHPELQFHVASFKQSQREWCEQQLLPEDRQLPLEFHVGKTSEIIALADFAIMVSGSVSLELLARGTPGIVVYRVGRALYGMAQFLVHTKSMTLPNLIAGKTIMPEFVTAGNPERTIRLLQAEADKLISDPVARQCQRDQLLDLASQYGQPGASRKAAQSIISWYANHSQLRDKLDKNNKSEFSLV